MDCPTGEDEASCPAYYTFDDCNSLQDCHWSEDEPDDFDFIVVKSIKEPVHFCNSYLLLSNISAFLYIVKDLIDMGAPDHHGPASDPGGSLDGGLMFLKAEGDISDFSQYIASVSSPIFLHSDVACRFEFWYYIAGNIGQNGYLMPVLVPEEVGPSEISVLDHLTSSGVDFGIWQKSIIGIGRQKNPFQMRFMLEPNKEYDAGLAIDDLGFVGCELKPPLDECLPNYFHCTTSLVINSSLNAKGCVSHIKTFRFIFTGLCSKRCSL
jgi:hypothetical protein